METQRVQANGIMPPEKMNSHSPLKVNSKVPSDRDMASDPLLSESGAEPAPALDPQDEKNTTDQTTMDLNKVNAMKTEEARKREPPTVNVAAYYKPDRKEPGEDDEEDEDGEGPREEGVKFIGLGDDDSIISSVADDEGPQIPDGGWGWVVVASAFFISTVADGLAFSFGLLHVEFHSEFGATQAITSWIGSLFISVPLIAGPIMSALVDRYGCRMMTIVGGLVSTLGFILAALCNSITTMLITFGVLAGLGMGLLYVTAVVSIAYWFEKKRNLAVSLGACGIGFGTVVFSPLTKFLIFEFGWRWAIVLLSGSLLNMCVCGAVMRDPEWWILEQKKQAALNKSKRHSSSVSISARSARSGGADSVFPGIEELKELMKSGQTPEYILTTLVTSIAVAENLDATTKMNAETTLSSQKVNSVLNLPTYLKQSEKVPQEVLEQLFSNKRLYNIMLENYPSLLALRSNSEQKLPVESPPELPKNKRLNMSMKLKLNRKKPEPKMEVGPNNLLLPPIPENKRAVIVKADKTQDKAQGYRQDWLTRQLSGHHYLRDIRIHRNSMMHRGAMMNIMKYKLRASSCPNIYRNSMLSLEEEEEERAWYHKFSDICKQSFDVSMFTEFHFFLMTMSTILLFVWFIVPYFYLIDFLNHNGSEATSEAGTTMMAIIGASSTVGLILLGWAGDRPWVNVTIAYAICLMLCGVSLLLFPLLIENYILLAINSAAFGFCFSSSYSYTPSILVDLIPLEKFTMAYGLILLAQGVGHLIGPPIAGTLNDNTGRWDMSFYMAGIWVIVSGVLVGIIPYTKNRRMCGKTPLAKDAEKLSQGRSHKDSTSVA